MANKKIYELPSDVGINMTDNDLYPVDKYLGVGSYTTVFKSGLNMKNYISNYITTLPTSTFTNVNISINNIKTVIYNTFDYYGYTTNTKLQPGSSSSTYTCSFPHYGDDNIYKLIVKLRVNKNGYTSFAETEIIIRTTSVGVAPTILQQTNINSGGSPKVNNFYGATFTVVPVGPGFGLQGITGFLISANITIDIFLYNTTF